MTIPDLMPLSDYDPSTYINEIYTVFKNNVVNGNLSFLELPITCPWHPSYDDKHSCFWHAISEKGDTHHEDDRLPDMRRCERILWIAYIINNAADKERVWCWEKSIKTKRGRSKHIHLYLHEASYLVVLRRKNNRLEFVTSFVRNQKKPKLEKEKYNDPR